MIIDLVRQVTESRMKELMVIRTLPFLVFVCLCQLTDVSAADPVPDPVPPSVVGIGVALKVAKDGIGYEVLQVVPNSPADLCCEIQAGDTIVGVGEGDTFPEDIAGLSFEELVNQIRGPIDTEVRLRIIPQASTFVKEKIISLKRRPLMANQLIGQRLVIDFTSVEDRKTFSVDKFEGQPVMLLFWSKQPAGSQAKIRKRAAELRQQIPKQSRLIAVNCDEVIEDAKGEWKGMERAWVDPKAIEVLSSEKLPVVIVISPKGQVDAICQLEAINLEKFLPRYFVDKETNAQTSPDE